jgi:hypothetical protein
MIEFWRSRDVDVVFVKSLEGFLQEIRNEMCRLLVGSQRDPGDEIRDLELAIRVQRVLELIDGRNKRIIVKSIVDVDRFSGDKARQWGLNVENNNTLKLLLDLGCLRIVNPSTGNDPDIFAFDLDVRSALRKWSR